MASNMRFKHVVKVYVFMEFFVASGSRIHFERLVSDIGCKEYNPFPRKIIGSMFHHFEIPAGKSLRNFVPKQGPLGKNTETLPSLDGCIQSLQPVQGTFQLISLRAENVVKITYNEVIHNSSFDAIPDKIYCVHIIFHQYFRLRS